MSWVGRIGFLLLVLFSCHNNVMNKNNIEIFVKVIDRYDKTPRNNDSVELRVVKKTMFSMWNYVLINKKNTNKLGVVSFKISNKHRYSISSFGDNDAFGSTEILEGELKNFDTIIIDVVTADTRKHKFLNSNNE